MGHQTEFDLKQELEIWRSTLLDSNRMEEENILELENHLLDQIEDLTDNGLSDDEAYWVAQKRLGQPNLLVSEYKKVEQESTQNEWQFFVKGGLSFFLLFFIINVLSTGLIELGQYINSYSLIFFVCFVFGTLSLGYLMIKRMSFYKLKKYIERKSIASLSGLTLLGAILYRGGSFVVMGQANIEKSIQFVKISNAVNVASLAILIGSMIWFWYSAKRQKELPEYI